MAPTQNASVRYQRINREEAAFELCRRLRAAGFQASATYDPSEEEHVRAWTTGMRGMGLYTWKEAENMTNPIVVEQVNLKVVRLPHGADLDLPKYETAGAAGMDLRAAIYEPIILAPGQHKLVPTGLSFAIPPGFEVQVRPRSGLAAKHGISIVNSPGTVDCDYRGEVKVILINHGREPFTIHRGERIGQMVLAPVVQAAWEEVDALDETERGAGGYGSTGRS